MRTLPAEMRQKVLGAAELFAEFGVDGTKMEEIASATGIPKATLYYYFEGKEDILAYLFNEVLDEVGRAVDGALGGGDTAAQRLRAAIAAHLGVFDRLPAASLALQLELGRAARIPHINERIEEAFRRPVCKLLEEGAVDGSVRPVAHPGLLAVAILGAVTTVGINAIALGPGRPVDDIVEDVIDFVVRGIEP